MRDAGGQVSRSQTQKVGVLMAYLGKMKGSKNRGSLPKVSLINLVYTALGSFAGISFITVMSTYYNISLLLPSFGASAVLLYSVSHLPMAQPRNVIGGHLMSALAGVTVYQLFGMAWWTIALGVTMAAIAMSLTCTLHPPGGATAFVAVYTHQNFDFILTPVGLGAICLIIIALLVNNLAAGSRYPEYWI